MPEHYFAAFFYDIFDIFYKKAKASGISGVHPMNKIILFVSVMAIILGQNLNSFVYQTNGCAMPLREWKPWINYEEMQPLRFWKAEYTSYHDANHTWLADNYPIAGLVFSLGDILYFLGIIFFMAALCEPNSKTHI